MMQSLFVFVLAIVCVTAGYNSGQSSAGGDSSKPVGIGSYAYQDSSGNRYEGTYDIKPEDIPNLVYAPAFTGLNFGPGFPFGENGFPDFGPGFPFGENGFGPDFGPGLPFGKTGIKDYAKNLKTSTRDKFSDISEENLGFNMNHNHLHSFDNLGEHYAQEGMRYGQGYNNFIPDYASNMPNFHQVPQGGNNAYAAGFVGPDGVRQVASISPANPNNPNIDVSYQSNPNPNKNFYSVSSHSFSSSSDVGGKKTETRGAKTVVNDNGKVTEYEVNN